MAPEEDVGRWSREDLLAAYERERQAAEQLRAADRLKDEFLSVVSHELRTPLASILGFAFALSDERRTLDTAMQKDLLQRIIRNANEMRRMVERLLDFSRLQAGKIDLLLVPLALRPAVDRCLANLADMLEHRPVEVDVPDDLVVLADEDGFNRVVQNLLANAAKFSPPDAPVTVRAAKDGGFACTTVIDHGPGIPAERQEHIFERFVQLPDQPSGGRGAGVGLAIVARYVEVQGGKIWVKSQPGRGAAFSFTLPLHDAAR